jgi:hypothetical protein
MADTTADNQATKPTPSTPLAPAPDLGDGPWDMSTGINNPNNQRDYTREPKGTINTNGGLLGVMGNVFDKLMELLARLFGNLIGKDTESIADQKADAEFRSDSIKFAKEEYDRGKEKANNHYEVNKSLNIPEYANKDLASEYLMFTRFGNNKLLFTDRDQKNGAYLEASLKENFMRCFSISIDQIKGYKGDKDIKDSVPFAIWMASPVYKQSFDASIDKDALLANLTPEEKELLKQAKFKTKSERDELFKSHPELEDKFTFVRNTALAVSNADMMATTMATETGIDRLSVPDFRFSASGQMGALQLTAQTALEFADKTFDKQERISLGQKVLAELHASGRTSFSESQVKQMVEHILGNGEYGGDRATFIGSLTTYLNGCKNKTEVEAMVGSISKIFGDENNYLQLQQNIMNAKMAIAINKVGGAERFNSIMQGDDLEAKGQLMVDMSNYYKFDHGAPKFSARELYSILSNGKEAKTEKDALFELGKLADQDSKIVFAVSHVTYHGTENKKTLAETFANVNVFKGKDVLAADNARYLNADTFLVALKDGDLNPDKEAQKYYLAKATDIADLDKSSLKNLLLDPAFKDYDLVKGVSAKEMANMLEKAKISDEDRKNPVFQAFVKSLKEKPDMHLDGVPMEYITKMATDIRDSNGVKNDLKVDIEKLHKDVVAQRETYKETLFSAITPAKAQRGDILLKELETNDLRKMVVEIQKAKDPNFAQLLAVLEKEKDTDISSYKNIGELQARAIGEKYNETNSLAVNMKTSAMREDQNKSWKAKEDELNKKNKEENEFIAENGYGHGWSASREDENEADLLASQKEADTRRLDSFEKEVRAVDISLRELKAGDKDALNDPERLAQSIKLLTYGSKVVNSGGLDYQSLRDLTAQAMVNNKMFASVADAKYFLEQISMNQEDNPLNMNRGKFLEDRMETLFKNKEISAQLASFIVEQKLLDRDSFKKTNPFDSMHQIFVTTTDGKRMNILDYGEEGKGYAHNDYLALYKEENNAQLANKTDDAPKGLDSKALAEVKEQANNKKEDVKVASIGI